MREILIRILTVSLLCGLLELMTPAGEREGLRRAVRLLSALFLLTVLSDPLIALGEAVQRFDPGGAARQLEEAAQAEYGDMMEEKLTAATVAQLEETLYEMLDTELGVARKDCHITVETARDGEAMRVGCVWIALWGEGILTDPRRIESRITETVGCPCSVSLGKNHAKER